MVVVTHLAGLPERAPRDPVRVEVTGEALAFHHGGPCGWSHYVPLAAVTAVRLAPDGAGPPLVVEVARRRGAATIELGGEPAALAALARAIEAGRRGHHGRRGVRRRPAPAG